MARIPCQSSGGGNDVQSLFIESGDIPFPPPPVIPVTVPFPNDFLLFVNFLLGNDANDGKTALTPIKTLGRMATLLAQVSNTGWLKRCEVTIDGDLPSAPTGSFGTDVLLDFGGSGPVGPQATPLLIKGSGSGYADIGLGPLIIGAIALNTVPLTLGVAVAQDQFKGMFLSDPTESVRFMIVGNDAGGPGVVNFFVNVAPGVFFPTFSGPSAIIQDTTARIFLPPGGSYRFKNFQRLAWKGVRFATDSSGVPGDLIFDSCKMFGDGFSFISTFGSICRFRKTDFTADPGSAWDDFGPVNPANPFNPNSSAGMNFLSDVGFGSALRVAGESNLFGFVNLSNTRLAVFNGGAVDLQNPFLTNMIVVASGHRSADFSSIGDGVAGVMDGDLAPFSAFLFNGKENSFSGINLSNSSLLGAGNGARFFCQGVGSPVPLPDVGIDVTQMSTLQVDIFTTASGAMGDMRIGQTIQSYAFLAGNPPYFGFSEIDPNGEGPGLPGPTLCRAELF